MVADIRKVSKTNSYHISIEEHIGRLWSDAMNNLTAMSKSPNWRPETEQNKWIVERLDHQCGDDLVLQLLHRGNNEL